MLTTPMMSLGEKLEKLNTHFSNCISTLIATEFLQDSGLNNRCNLIILYYEKL